MNDRNSRVNASRYLGTVRHRSDTGEKIKQTGDLVIVKRGIIRAAVMLCPSGCGEEIVINLDERAGPAWSFYNNERGVTLYPSIWRGSSCRSHFIIWNDRVFWLDHDWIDYKRTTDIRWDSSIIGSLGNNEYIHYADIAKDLGEIPWTILLACRRLKKLGTLKEGTGEKEGQFKLRSRRKV